MTDNYGTLNVVDSIDAVVAERHKLLDLSDPCVVQALGAAKTRIGGALYMARQYGAAGFVLQYHSQTRLAQQYMKKPTTRGW